MSEWAIVRIEEDPGGTPAEDRWHVVMSVPVEYSPDGTFSYSFPKSKMNTYAAVFEYDVEDPGQLDDLFDLVMSIPMLKARPRAAPRPAGHPARMTARAATRVDSLSEAVNTARLAAHPKHAMVTAPALLRADILSGIGAMKDGEAPLVAAQKVVLSVTGLPGVADDGENPKYVIMRDMVSRIEPDRIAAGLAYYRRQRESQVAEAAQRGGTV